MERDVCARDAEKACDVLAVGEQPALDTWHSYPEAQGLGASVNTPLVTKFWWTFISVEVYEDNPTRVLGSVSIAADLRSEPRLAALSVDLRSHASSFFYKADGDLFVEIAFDRDRDRGSGCHARGTTGRRRVDARSEVSCAP